MTYERTYIGTDRLDSKNSDLDFEKSLGDPVLSTYMVFKSFYLGFVLFDKFTNLTVQFIIGTKVLRLRAPN